MGISARELALKILIKTDGGAYSDNAVKEALPQLENKKDRALVTELVYGVICHRTRLDYSIGQLSRIPLKKLSKWILNILRMGLYQLYFLDKIPESAAVNESVKLAKRFGHSASAGYVNGVLRSAASQNEPAMPDDLSVIYSHPQWLVNMWISHYGRDFTEQLLRSNNSQPDVTIRVNTLKITAGSLAERLAEKGIEAIKENEFCLSVRGMGNIGSSEEYNEGLFTVQDKASMNAVLALDPKPGSSVMDLCAAPGGKTTFIAQLMQNKGVIKAFDLYEHKIDIINKNAQRMGIDIINAEVYSAEIFNEKYAEWADYVLADVPCSGLGIIRKKPDIKWTKCPEDIDELIKIQKVILSNAARYVKKGGRLVYSTCTVSKKENEGQIADFLKEHKNFRLLEQKQYFPNTDGCDGFFTGVLECTD